LTYGCLDNAAGEDNLVSILPPPPVYDPAGHLAVHCLFVAFSTITAALLLMTMACQSYVHAVTKAGFPLWFAYVTPIWGAICIITFPIELVAWRVVHRTHRFEINSAENDLFDKKMPKETNHIFRIIRSAFYLATFVLLLYFNVLVAAYWYAAIAALMLTHGWCKRSVKHLERTINCWCQCKVGVVRAKLENLLEEEGFEQRSKQQVWAELTTIYTHMDAHLEKAYWLNAAGGPFIIEMAQRMITATYCWVIFVGYQCKGAIICEIGWASIGVILVVQGTNRLWIKATVSEEIQSLSTGIQSIARLAMRFTNDTRMSAEEKADHWRFVQYVLCNKAGIGVPILGLLRREQITHYAGILSTVLPVLFGITLKAFDPHPK